MDASDLLAHVRIVPVLVLRDAEQAVPLAHTLRDAGLTAVEVTLRTPAALDAIARIARSVPDLIVGAGSIRFPSQFEEIARAGARFAVSPGATDALLGAAASASMPFVPGSVTAGEILKALEAGYTLQKFFPAEISGGAPALRALSAPIPEVRFFPTGGIDAAKLGDYLSVPAVACVGGSWFVASDALESGDYDAIGEAAAAAVASAQDPAPGSARA